MAYNLKVEPFRQYQMNKRILILWATIEVAGRRIKIRLICWKLFRCPLKNLQFRLQRVQKQSAGKSTLWYN
ncbi:MAG: hypothetical protein A3G45_01010 [Candidatus Staskawiczbacteria bacterium RIFCSPLOWO2_12_FULL_37_15]|uniref:Uncharacterized protein n=1 Tax=Candidatus Staskawiczbacteria bacterium RIFCSPLOWO2_12_FULL_37_15 TaxID=1802218 RepID=A0A1G2IKW8_9BACT|nr:MAG: hypothetical protein A3G45_01010 [Candidatus Staskawiczbacteria bacterium RIFCSPLOWO2_12_FULL_37_15]